MQRKPPDPRINPYRSDIAASKLRGVVDTLCFVEGNSHTVIGGVTPIKKKPSAQSEQVNELRYGDGFTAYEIKDGWAWGQSSRDDYVGYVNAKDLTKKTFTPTHRIKNLSSFIFPEASIKTPPIDRLTFFSSMEIVREGEKFCELNSGGFVHAHHLMPIKSWQENDFIATAMKLLNVPYLWGGVTPMGIDCSGLIQLSLNAAGIPCPRDSDMQAENLGVQINDAHYQRGDIAFFPGHVGFMADSTNLLHANAYHGCVVVEPLADVVARGSKVSFVKRLAF